MKQNRSEDQNMNITSKEQNDSIVQNVTQLMQNAMRQAQKA